MNYHLIKVPVWHQSISNKIWRRKNRICDILTIRSSYSFTPHVRTYFWATISYKYHAIWHYLWKYGRNWGRRAKDKAHQQHHKKMRGGGGHLFLPFLRYIISTMWWSKLFWLKAKYATKKRFFRGPDTRRGGKGRTTKKKHIFFKTYFWQQKSDGH